MSLYIKYDKLTFKPEEFSHFWNHYKLDFPWPVITDDWDRDILPVFFNFKKDGKLKKDGESVYPKRIWVEQEIIKAIDYFLETEKQEHNTIYAYIIKRTDCPNDIGIIISPFFLNKKQIKRYD